MYLMKLNIVKPIGHDPVRIFLSRVRKFLDLRFLTHIFLNKILKPNHGKTALNSWHAAFLSFADFFKTLSKKIFHEHSISVGPNLGPYRCKDYQQKQGKS